MKKMIMLSVALVLILTGCTSQKNVLGIEEAKVKAEDFINNTLLAGNSTATISEFVEESGLYKMSVSVEGQEAPITSYLTLDGEKFFPSAPFDIEETKKAATDNAAAGDEADAPATAQVVKSEKPAVELFVMSHCPFGTQIEKGILPVLETLGDSVDFKLRFCDYAMHGKKELDEQLNQTCIQKEYPDKLYSYLSCFLQDETSSDKCMDENNINKKKITDCVAQTDTEYKVTEMYNDQTTWASGKFPKFEVDGELARTYGVKGSPTLVINGAQASSGRSPAELLKVICSSFENRPAECDTELSSTNPSSGFGGGTAASADGGCGS